MTKTNVERLLVVLMAIGVVVLAFAVATPVKAADAPGAATYKAKCGACHGPDGAGQTGMGKSLKLRDLGSADVQKQSDADLTTIVTKGKGKMPAYDGKLSADEIKGVVAYVRSLKK